MSFSYNMPADTPTCQYYAATIHDLTSSVSYQHAVPVDAPVGPANSPMAPSSYSLCLSLFPPSCCQFSTYFFRYIYLFIGSGIYFPQFPEVSAFSSCKLLDTKDNVVGMQVSTLACQSSCLVSPDPNYGDCSSYGCIYCID